jgi:ABC-2 type transport system permease protein
VLANVVMGTLLIFCGVNVALTAMPDWMASVGSVLPLTHGIEAARDTVAGASPAEVSGLLFTEAGIGIAYVLVGLVLLAYFERSSRQRASLDLA